MAFCRQCGERLPVGARFCPRCRAVTEQAVITQDEVTEAAGGPAGRRPSSTMALAGLAALLVAISTVAIAGWWWSHRSSGPVDPRPVASASSSAPPATDTAGDPPSNNETTASPTQKHTQPMPTLALTGAFCESRGAGAVDQVAVGDATTTSCAFAVSVHDAFLAASSPRDSPFAAHSSATGLDYAVVCTGDQPVRCLAGTNAVVLLYHGEATFTP